MSLQIRIAQPEDRDVADSIYKAWGYGAGFRPEDTIWLAESDGEIVAIVRIAPEHSLLVLRGMRVREDHRAKGIGSQVLAEVTGWIGDRECYCVPYAHLPHFYERFGFRLVPDADGPPHLRDRLALYRTRGTDVVLMKR